VSARTARGMSMQRVPTAGRWAIYIALAVVFAIACAFLADWQFTRNEERAAQLDLVARNYDQSPVPLSTLMAGTSDFDADDEWRPVALQGRYLSDEEVLVRNRPRGGTSAFEVLTPFLLDDGRIVIVDRGWVPPASDSAGPSAVPAAPAGDVTVTARLRPGEPAPASGRGAPDGQVATIDLPLIAEDTGATTVTAAYALMVAEDPAPATRPESIDPPTADPGPHLSYAIQWILFAVMGFVFIGYVIRTEITHRREDLADVAPDDGEPTPPRPRHDRSARRRDRDMEDEDAILDAATR
jgi:cytochrome oxidase assembly protein ShyY1